MSGVLYAPRGRLRILANASATKYKRMSVSTKPTPPIANPIKSFVCFDRRTESSRRPHNTKRPTATAHTEAWYKLRSESDAECDAHENAWIELCHVALKDNRADGFLQPSKSYSRLSEMSVLRQH